MEYKDYYKIMGVQRDASQDDIKRAYRKLARKYHPDVSKEADAEERFKELGEAYEVLKDPQKRQAYDQLGRDWKHGQQFRPPPDWASGFDFSGGGFTQADASQFSDFFESLFGGFRSDYSTHRGGFRARGEDLHARLRISLEEAYHGTTREVSLNLPADSDHGSRRQQQRTLKVRVPKGIKRGQRIRLAGEGGRGFGAGAPPGDLYLEVDFEPHHLFQCEGQDIFLNVPVAPWEAALGAEISVPTLGGEVDMKVPPGSQSGHKLRLKKRGLPGNLAGDQIVTLRIETPPAVTKAAREAYQHLAEAVPFNPRERLATSK
ncbi:DnaJ C-terminal domain-containing protein [Sulfuriflexus sp.]|uniref:DnaJ C-terminal domain-containing protein n=1 Tax=Sulfuriflexus sp. TaxID=2015443 RepID=UPI0028CD2E63|nr:DnaJ C-terminal domain-containing protein [Sulfuriflexus sp.]MDT8404724.1 DnaJ C-terminal domain-containing protein [Sulfuriflexus sp.]